MKARAIRSNKNEERLEYGVSSDLPALNVCRLEPPEQLLRKLQQHVNDPALANFTCPICWDPFWQPVRTVCGHAFCEACLLQAVLSQLSQDQPDVSCPLCRTPLHVDDVTMDQALLTRIRMALSERERRSNSRGRRRGTLYAGRTPQASRWRPSPVGACATGALTCADTDSLCVEPGIISRPSTSGSPSGASSVAPWSAAKTSPGHDRHRSLGAKAPVTGRQRPGSRENSGISVSLLGSVLDRKSHSPQILTGRSFPPVKCVMSGLHNSPRAWTTPAYRSRNVRRTAWGEHTDDVRSGTPTCEVGSLQEAEDPFPKELARDRRHSGKDGS